jgi:DDE family transposase
VSVSKVAPFVVGSGPGGAAISCALLDRLDLRARIAPHRQAQPGPPKAGVVKFYNGRGTAEQHIKEGKNALRWTRLSCHAFRDNAVRLQLHALAYNLANFLRTLALPERVEHWSLTTLREKLVKIGARIVRHGR